MTENTEQHSEQPTCPQCGLQVTPSEEQCPHCARLQDEAPATITTAAPPAAALPIMPPVHPVQQSVPLLPPPLLSPTMSEQPAGKPAELIIVAVLLLIGAFSGLILFLTNMHNIGLPSSPSPMLSSREFHTISLMAMIMALLNLIAKTVFGIGLLRLSPWARTATVYGLVILCLLGCTHQLYSTSVMKKPMQQMMSSSMDAHTSSGSSGSTNMPSASSILQVFMTGAIILALFIAITYTALLIFLLCRPGVKRAFGD